MNPEFLFPDYMPGRDAVRRALRGRLEALTHVLVGAVPAASDEDDNGSAGFSLVVDRLAQAKRTDELWLTLTVLSTVFPSERLVLEGQRNMAVMTRAQLFSWILTATAEVALETGRGARPVEIVSNEVIVDVDGCARSNRNTGIQRVVRETVPRWVADHALRLVEWNDVSTGFQDLPPDHRSRVLDWATVKPAKETSRMDDSIRSPLIVPWRSRIVLPEVSSREQSAVYESIGRYSGNTIGAIGYDCIPLVSPEVLPPPGGTDFMHFLRVLRQADVVAPISRAARAEFAGFFASVAAQHRSVPRVVECELASDAPPAAAFDEPVDSGSSRPLLVAVGSHEPRKNHLAVLHCAETLWREGLDFELIFLGGSGFGTTFDTRLAELIADGRPVTARQGVSDTYLWRAYRRARFTLFPSTHEGYGLPVAESIASGTPVITTAYGSTLEIAERGGALLIDPRSDADLLQAMRRLLVDEDEYQRLRAECAVAPLRTWAEYADELWQVIAVPEAVDAARAGAA